MKHEEETKTNVQVTTVKEEFSERFGDATHANNHR
jgi:hypothetical protein